MGNDTLVGGTGNDSLDGGGQTSDTLDYSYVVSGGTTDGIHGVTLTLNGSTASSVTGLAATDQDTIKNFENVIGTSFNDDITGDANANSIFGGAGDDTLTGGGGNDTLSGGFGNDVLKLDWSSLNLSNLDGGAGTDTVMLSGTGSVSLNFTASSFTGVLSNAEYLDFSNATSSNNVSVNLDGAGIQKILTGSTSNSNAGILDLKLDAGHNDTLTLAANGTYSYWDAATGGNQISNGTSATSVNVSALTTAGADIYVFDSTHTTLLADLHYHV